MMVRLLMLATCVAAGLSGTARAADDDTDTRLAAARDMMAADQYDQMEQVRITLIVDRAKTQYREMRTGASPALVDHYGDVLREELQRDETRLADAKAHYYAEHFSAADLKAWAAMLRSDIGKKMLASQPVVMRDFYSVDDLWVQGALARTMTRLAAETDGS